MKISGEDFEIHISRGVGSVLEDSLRTAEKRLWIVSPWISPEYADFMVNKKEKGVDVQLITSLETQNKGAFSKLLKKEKRKVTKKVLGLIPSEKIHTYFVSKLGKGNLVVFKSKWKGHRSERFTHTKIYIWDDSSAMGSVNFTKSGFWNNVETLWFTKNKRTTEKIAEAFQKLKNHPMMNRAEMKEIVEYAHIPDEEIKKRETEFEKLEKKLRKKANEALRDIFKT